MFRDSNIYQSDGDGYDPGEDPGEDRRNQGKKTMAPSNLILALAGLAAESEPPIGLVRHARDKKRIKQTAITRITTRKRIAV